MRGLGDLAPRKLFALFFAENEFQGIAEEKGNILFELGSCDEFDCDKSLFLLGCISPSP